MKKKIDKPTQKIRTRVPERFHNIVEFHNLCKQVEGWSPEAIKSMGLDPAEIADFESKWE
jgi:hypothetical protein